MPQDREFIPEGIALADLRIGSEFLSAPDRRWRVTDVGSRCAVAIQIEEGRDPVWYDGPPYPVVEHVFDEFDLEGCDLVPVDPTA